MSKLQAALKALEEAEQKARYIVGNAKSEVEKLVWPVFEASRHYSRGDSFESAELCWDEKSVCIEVSFRDSRDTHYVPLWVVEADDQPAAIAKWRKDEETERHQKAVEMAEANLARAKEQLEKLK